MTSSSPENSCPICGSEKICHWGSARDIGLPHIRHTLSKCAHCTHLFINPLPTPEFLQQAYKLCNPSVFTSNGFVEARSHSPLSVADETVLSLASRCTAKGAFLDIGSANLTLLKMIKDIGWLLSIVEPSQHAKQFEDILKCTVYNCCFEECEFEYKYDLISAIDVLEHVYSPVEFLKRVKDILSEEGCALFRFPNSYSIRCNIRHDKWDMIRPLGHLHYFSPRSFEVACEISSLQIKKLDSHDINKYRFGGTLGKLFNWLILRQSMTQRLDRSLKGDQLFATVINAS